METTLKRISKLNESQIHFLSSSFARGVQTIISNPLIVIKTRLEVIGFNEYDGIIDAGKKIYAREGMKGYTTGIGISLIRDVPHSGVFYPVYNSFKQFYGIFFARGNGKSDTMNLAIVSSLASWSANVVSCVLTHPIDLIRTRVYF
jgi:hypothetical protein